ncbi:protein MAIN-LIKE 1-like [Arachis hypogaea]|uniref:protein MAIN-LIKE 1-like n=1 Tax=Arachis hypogaea TaxID=3818 RepID=UPI003B20BF26
MIHMPFEECTITLHDVAYQLGLPIDGKAISGCLTDFEKVLPADATEDTICIYARVYIMMLLSTQLFGDKSANRVHIRWLSFMARLDEMGTYSWGSAALAWLYRCMCRVANKNATNLAGLL